MSDVRFYFVSGLTLCLMLITAPVWAQGPGQEIGGRETTGTAYYTFARPGQNTIEVLVVGGDQSGIYRVGEDINLGQLLALAGGGGRGDRRTKSRIHFYRLENGERIKILEEELGDLLNRSQYPSLENGDVLRVENRERIIWRDVLQISTTILSLGFTILNFLDVGQ